MSVWKGIVGHAVSVDGSYGIPDAMYNKPVLVVSTEGDPAEVLAAVAKELGLDAIGVGAYYSTATGLWFVSGGRWPDDTHSGLLWRKGGE